MKIILLTGISGAGKTAIAEELCKDNKYHYVNSYTDRPKREENEYGHDFIDNNYMDLILERHDVVAQTTIDNYRYCSIASQFDKNKVNVYIVDVKGMNDTIKYFPYADIMSILIRRDKVEADCVRINRDVCVPAREDVDFLVKNNYKIESAAALINTFVNFNLFSHPSHIVQDIQDKIEYVEKQYRYLNEIKESLYTQLWYNNKGFYIDLCKYLEEKINKEINFKVTITPDDKPAIYDGSLYFHIIAEYTDEDVMWADINRMIEQLSSYAYTYCEDMGYDDLSYYLSIGDEYINEV